MLDIEEAREVGRLMDFDFQGYVQENGNPTLINDNEAFVSALLDHMFYMLHEELVRPDGIPQKALIWYLRAMSGSVPPQKLAVGLN